jgi:WD40 repeat protein
VNSRPIIKVEDTYIYVDWRYSQANGSRFGKDERLRGKSVELFCSVFLILALIVPSLCAVHGYQVTQVKTAIPHLIPQAPTKPYWTYNDSSGYPWTVAVSKDGGTVVEGTYGGMIDVFGRQSNTTLWRYNTGKYVYSVAVSANGSTIVAGGYDNYTRVFSRQSNKTIWQYNTGATVVSVAVSADGNTIVAGGNDSIRVFGRQSNTTIWSYTMPYYVRQVAVSADGNTIVGGGYHAVSVFARQSNVPLWSYTSFGSLQGVYAIAVSADGSTIVTGSDDYYVRAFGRDSNTTLWTYYSLGKVLGVDASSDGTTIAACDLYGHMEVFGRASNLSVFTFNGGAHFGNSIALSSDGSVVACGSYNFAASRAYLFSKTLGLLLDYNVPNSISGFMGPIVGISGDGSLIAYGCQDGKIYVFQYDLVPPVLGTPSISPPNPIGGQNVSISVSATDNLGVSTVTLCYWNTTTSTWHSVAMSLSGAAYEATLGPFHSGDVVSYYVSATDTSGNTVTSPANAPLSYYTFLVGSSSTGAPTPASESVTNVLLGVAIGAVIVIVATLVARGKKSRG